MNARCAKRSRDLELADLIQADARHLGSVAQRNGPESLRKFHRKLLADGRRRFAMIA